MINEVCYVGIRRSDGRAEVWVETRDGDIGERRLLDPKPSQMLYNHSPDGFEWGYAGSGPAQLALAILLDACRRGPFPIGDLTHSMNWTAKGPAGKVALIHYQSFKFSVIAMFERDGFRLPLSEVREFLALEERK